MNIWKKEIPLRICGKMALSFMVEKVTQRGSSDVLLLSAQPSRAPRHANGVKRSKTLSGQSCNVQTRGLEVD